MAARMILLEQGDAQRASAIIELEGEEIEGGGALSD